MILTGHIRGSAITVMHGRREMMHKLTFTVSLTCQGQLMEKAEHRRLIPVLLHFAKLAIKYGKYGTMRIDLEAW